MSRRTYQLLALALTLSGTSACDEAPAFGAGDVALRPGGYGTGGILINTSATGDWAVAHLDRNFGVELDGVVLDSVVVKGNDKIEEPVALDKVWVKEGQIFGSWKWVEFSGADFEGSQWNLKIAGSQNAPERTMTLDKYVLDAEGRHRYTFLYPNDPNYGYHFWNFNYLFSKLNPGTRSDEEPQQQDLAVCAPDPDNNGSVEALVYGDVYVDMDNGTVKERLDTINIACLSGGVGKAGLWGYLPYVVGLDFFEAGVRTVRADYCGDGGTFTKPGNSVVLRDSFPVYPDFGQYAGNPTETIMGVKGALCLDFPRDSNWDPADVLCNGNQLPLCKDAKLEDFAPDGLIHSKLT
jgi:hypothetical protein